MHQQQICSLSHSVISTTITWNLSSLPFYCMFIFLPSLFLSYFTFYRNFCTVTGGDYTGTQVFTILHLLHILLWLIHLKRNWALYFTGLFKQWQPLQAVTVWHLRVIFCLELPGFELHITYIMWRQGNSRHQSVGQMKQEPLTLPQIYLSYLLLSQNSFTFTQDYWLFFTDPIHVTQSDFESLQWTLYQNRGKTG